jgi:hypothetical protein
VVLPENAPLSDIEAFFSAIQFQLLVHDEPPPEPRADEWRRMSTVVRQARKRAQHPYWVDLKRVETGNLVRWYASGENPEAAMRSARSRWRVEQGD